MPDLYKAERGSALVRVRRAPAPHDHAARQPVAHRLQPRAGAVAVQDPAGVRALARQAAQKQVHRLQRLICLTIYKQHC